MDYFFSHARTALKYGLKALNLSAGDEILVPAYVCDVVLHPLDELGIIPRFYPVTDELKPAWERLQALLSEKTHAILAVHYFGQPQEIPRYLEFCKLHDLLFVEDNAHGYGGTLEGNPLGTFGDIGISSPRKIMGWRNGGILHSKLNLEFPSLPAQPGKLSWKFKTDLKRLVFSNRALCNAFREMPDFHSHETGREGTIPDWSFDEAYRSSIGSMDVSRMAVQRRAVWGVWKKWALKQGLSPVFSNLSEGACPLAFPVRTRSAEESREWFKWGWKHGLYVHSWPALPRQVLASDAETVMSWETLVCFSILPEMDAGQLSKQLGVG